jgi:hypothetical protein
MLLQDNVFGISCNVIVYFAKTAVATSCGTKEDVSQRRWDLRYEYICLPVHTNNIVISIPITALKLTRQYENWSKSFWSRRVWPDTPEPKWQLTLL